MHHKYKHSNLLSDDLGELSSKLYVIYVVCCVGSFWDTNRNIKSWCTADTDS